MTNKDAIQNFYLNQPQPTPAKEQPSQGKTLGDLDLIRSVQQMALKPATPGAGGGQSKFELNPKNDKTKGWARSNING